MKDNLRQWRIIAVPPFEGKIDIKRLLLICGRILNLRVVKDEQGKEVFEVFCATDAEHAQAEALVHQAAADEVLRRDINSRCNNEIGTLVDLVLKRATGH